MKVWVIGRNVPTKHNRMNGSFELDQAKMLAEVNEVCFLTQAFCFGPGRNNCTPGYFYRSGIDAGVRVFSRTCPYFPGRLGIHWGAYVDAQWMVFIRRVLKETGVPDIVHVHYPAMIGNVKALSYLQGLGAKLVCTEHWSMVLLNRLDKYQRSTIQQLVKISDAFTCVGTPLAETVKLITGTKRDILVVPNMVSDLFRPTTKKSIGRPFRFVAVGRLVPMKQFDKIIKAFAMAFGDDDSTLLLVGDGQEKNSLLKLVQEVGLDGRVLFTGALSRQETAKAMAESDCLICFSEYETFGATIIEGWASGLPVIASNGLGSSAYWREGLGELVDHESLEDLVVAMHRVRSGYTRYDSMAISAYAVSTFGNDAIRKQLESIYEGL